MRAKQIIPLLFGIVGVAILLSLGTWQVRRLAEKEAVLAEIDARIGAEPGALPEVPDPARDKYLPVEVTGDLTGDSIRVLVSQKQIGAGYRYITAMETEAGRIMVDRGFVPVRETAAPVAAQGVTVQGNLHWPDEVDGYTPEPDLGAEIWFARDVEAMAAHLDTRPILIVARAVSQSEPLATPLGLDSSGIPNDHLEYAITWFSLAVIWAAMTVYFLWRQRRPDKGTIR